MIFNIQYSFRKQFKSSFVEVNQAIEAILFRLGSSCIVLSHNIDLEIEEL